MKVGKRRPREGKDDYRLRLGAAAVLVVAVLVVGICSRTWPGPFPGGGVEPALAPEVGEPTWDDLWLLARMVAAEAKGEPFQGQVAVAAVVLNRVRSPRFPATVAGVLFEPWAFQPVMNGSFWTTPVRSENIRAAELALSGWDPTYGSLYFWNPATAVSPWIWTRRIITSIGRHVFGL